MPIPAATGFTCAPPSDLDDKTARASAGRGRKRFDYFASIIYPLLRILAGDAPVNAHACPLTAIERGEGRFGDHRGSQSLVQHEAVKARSPGLRHATRDLELVDRQRVEREDVAMRGIARRRTRAAIVAVDAGRAGIEEVRV